MTTFEGSNELSSLAREIEMFLPLKPVDQTALGRSEYSLQHALGTIMVNFAFLEAHTPLSAAGPRQIDGNLAQWLFKLSDPKRKGALTDEEVISGLTFVADYMESPQFLTGQASKTVDVIDIVTMPDTAIRFKNKAPQLDNLYPKLHRRAQTALKTINSLTKISWQAMVDDEHSLHNSMIQMIERTSLRALFSVRLRNESGLAGAFHPVSAMRAIEDQDWEKLEPQKTDFLEALIEQFQADSLIAVVPTDLPWVDTDIPAPLDQAIFDDLRYLPPYLSLKNLKADRALFTGKHEWSIEAQLTGSEIDYLQQYGFLAFGLDIKDPTPHESAWGWTKRMNIMFLIQDYTKEAGCRPLYTSLLIDLNHPEPVCHLDLMQQPTNTRSTVILIQQIIKSQWNEVHSLALKRKPINIKTVAISRPRPATVTVKPIKSPDVFIEPPTSTAELPNQEAWDIISLEELAIPEAERQIAQETIDKWKEYEYQKISRIIKKYKGPGRLIRLRNNQRERVFLLEQPDGRLKVINVMRFKTEEDYDRYCDKPIDQYPFKKKKQS